MWAIVILAVAADGDSSNSILIARELLRDVNHKKPSTENRSSPSSFPDFYTHALKSCKDLSHARQIHAKIAGGQHRKNRYLANLIIQMYGRCGSMEEARGVFDGLDEPNVFSWTIIIAAYAKNGHLYEAKCLYDVMPDKDVVSSNSIIALYAQRGNIRMARYLFDLMPRRDIISWNSMVTAYASNGHLLEARRLFNEMPERDVVSWNALMSGYSQGGFLREARSFFESVPDPNIVTLNAMITAYVQAGDLPGAEETFESMEFHDAVSCTAMITGHSQQGNVRAARAIFNSMPENERDSIAWNAIVAAYAQVKKLEEAMKLFLQMPHKDMVSWNAMVSAYAQAGYMLEAKQIFDDMPKHNIVSWSALISGYAQNGHSRQAISLFKTMDLEGIQPNEVTFVSVLDACASAVAFLEGRLIHEDVVAAGLPLNLQIANALLDLYGKCGKVWLALGIFYGMPYQDEISWTAMIAAYVQAKLPSQALELLHYMSVEGVRPNAVTYVGVFSACSHKGSLEVGQEHFARMLCDYQVNPVMDHYKCVVDLLARAGKTGDAEDLILGMPFEADIVSWMTLLSACRVNGDQERGARASQQLRELDPKNVSSFVLLSNTIAT
ncbi:pentatricopeptide repeat-containing protein At4g02750-like [Selaginella moellendorffii]|uniref:pentatricopeptide repeat-containing protein At4g02750-like n=1 Tax=Selaginella moellendorffii TaxID=88036 RepID=UPI000D1C546C|nr:pentatricopeptide repeat-containing protein At4g02750-like [Selaginella moellendorffii]|eukprot:XP_024517209.1 pentatricopeptide repeat-containing protein At4g02750-like [Selaginella moellendorffii]